MSATEVSEGLLTKKEALDLVNTAIDRPGIMDMNTFLELLTWQNKLLLWILQERKGQSNEKASC